MKSQWILQGQVTSGAQKAAYFTQLDWLQQQCQEKLGFIPFPGTLNVDVASDFHSMITDIQNTQAIELLPPDDKGCSGRALPVSIGSINCAIIIPEQSINIHDANILEIMASVSLRDELELNDGDNLTLHIEKPGRTDLEAVIFDLDGTLIDSVGVYFKIVNITLSKLGFPKVTVEAMREALVNGDFKWQRVLPEFIDINQPGLMEKIQEVVEEVYQPLFEQEVEPIPGVKESIEGLAAAGIKMAIVTSTPRVNMGCKLNQLKANDTLQYFDIIITSDDAPQKKPAPDPMFECCKQLGVDIAASVYIGDTCVDIESGRTAGMKTIAVLSGFDDTDSLCKELPDALINSVAELKSIIRYDTPN